MVKAVKTWKTDDGKEFDSRSEAEAHEAKLKAEGVLLGSDWRKHLEGLLPQDISDAINGANRPVMEAVLKWAGAINKARASRGEVQPRKPKPVEAQPANGGGDKGETGNFGSVGTRPIGGAAPDLAPPDPKAL